MSLSPVYPRIAGLLVQRGGCFSRFPFLTGDSFHIVRLHSGRDVKTIKLVFGDLGH